MNMQNKEQFSFTKAERKKAKLKLNLNGASGSGKTYSALVLASSLGKKIAVIDTENESASLYANEFNFDTLPLKPPYSPERFAGAIHAAHNMGYEVLIIDSAVMNGLELVDVWKSTMKQLNVLKVTLGQLGQKPHHVTANLLTRFFKQICTLSLQL
ncbi:AAA family ATPase, partial [Acinetobacter baumannii]|uniref:AAA family ATPase n=1 Tax=Acinetobacter baumannii TaxID=470 RepID=UPI0028935F85